VILRWRRAYRLQRATPPARTPDRPPRPSRQELERLAIAEGRSDAELAARYDRSAATIWAWRAQEGLARPRRRIDRACLVALCQQGLPARQIAQQLGCTPGTVYKLAKAAGVQVASSGNPPTRRLRTAPTAPPPAAAPRRTVRLAGPNDLDLTRNPEDGVVADQEPTDQDLTATQVAGLFGVSQTAVWKWAEQGRLPFRQIRGQRRYPAPAIARLAHQHQVPLPDWLAKMITSTSSEAS
jgi:DNA-directed RNA polymerase specialized sigma24 family protein